MKYTKMNIIRNSVISIVAAAALASCDSQLDLVPKGQTTLDKTSDLEMLLNQEYGLGEPPYNDLGQICGESLGMGLSVPEVTSSKNTLNYAYMHWDEDVDRATLAQTDSRYNQIYKYINYYNTILTKIDAAQGDEARKPAIKAEARVLRAYLHWIAAVIYAPQYDAAEIDNLGGIAFVTDIDNNGTKEKLPLKRAYELILDDCGDELIETLPDNDNGVCRPDKAFGYALRGKVLMQMKRYDEALPYLRKSVEMNDHIDDRAYIKETQDWVIERQDKGNLLYMGAGVRVCPTMCTITKETDAKFEKGDYVYKYCGDSGWSLSYGNMYAGIPGVRMFMGWSAMGNPWGMTSVRTMLSLAECLVRTGDIRGGLEIVDSVRKAHVENAAPYVRIHDMMPFNEKAAMKLLQQTKWTECIGSYENFFDMKRWNSEDDYRQTLTKDLGEYGTVTLESDSKLWILPFPANAVRYNPTLTQNF